MVQVEVGPHCPSSNPTRSRPFSRDGSCLPLLPTGSALGSWWTKRAWYTKYSITSVKESVHPKPLFWIGSSYEDLLDCPDEVRRTFGFALGLAQAGGKYVDAKPLRGFGGAGVLEVVED